MAHVDLKQLQDFQSGKVDKARTPQESRYHRGNGVYYPFDANLGSRL
jgi:hypothetical protein